MGTPPSPPRITVGVGAPALLALLGFAIGFTPGRSIVLGLLAAAPVLAAGLVGPRLTALHGMLALAADLSLWLVRGLPGSDEPFDAPVPQLAAIALFSVLAVALAADRVRRERRLRSADAGRVRRSRLD